MPSGDCGGERLLDGVEADAEPQEHCSEQFSLGHQLECGGEPSGTAGCVDAAWHSLPPPVSTGLSKATLSVSSEASAVAARTLAAALTAPLLWLLVAVAAAAVAPVAAVVADGRARGGIGGKGGGDAPEKRPWLASARGKVLILVHRRLPRDGGGLLAERREAEPSHGMLRLLQALPATEHVGLLAQLRAAPCGAQTSGARGAPPLRDFPLPPESVGLRSRFWAHG